MPTLLPHRPPAEPRLSLPETVRFLVLVASVRLLDLRMHAEVRRGQGFADDRLLRLMRRWLALHERVAALLPGIPEPEHVREVRAILRPLDEIKRRAADVRPHPPARSLRG